MNGWFVRWARLCLPVFIISSAIVVRYFVAPISLGWIQGIAAPLILIWLFVLIPTRISTKIIISSVMLIASVWAVVRQLDCRSEVCVAAVVGDANGGKSFNVQQQLRENSADKLSVSTLVKEFSKNGDARRWLNSHPHVAVLVWHFKERTVLELPTKSPETIRSLLGREPVDGRLGDLKMLFSVPRIILSLDEGRYTFKYIARLAVILSAGGWKNHSERQVQRWQELAGMRGGWSSYSHLSFAYWGLANAQVLRAMEATDTAGSTLACALKNYQKALTLLGNHRSPKLVTVLSNNYLLAVVLKGVIESNRKAIRFAQKKIKNTVLKLGATRSRNKFPTQYYQVMKENLVVVNRILKMSKKRLEHRSAKLT